MTISLIWRFVDPVHYNKDKDVRFYIGKASLKDTQLHSFLISALYRI